jgi:hypothetical protein
VSEARQSAVVDAAEFAVKIGGLRLHICKRPDGSWIFLAPVKPSPSQELRAAIFDAGGHAKAVQLYLVQPLWP